MQEYEEYEEYEDEDEYEDEGRSRAVNKILLVVIGVLVIAVGTVGFFLIRNLRRQDDTRIGLALTREELDAAMEQANENAKSSSIALRFQNTATSEDGQLFQCYIMNSQLNIYDMFLVIYADDMLTDELFSSGLVAPGRGFDQIKLNRALEKGSHTVYVVLTQVETDEDGVQSIVGQTSHTMDFYVE